MLMMNTLMWDSSPTARPRSSVRTLAACQRTPPGSGSVSSLESGHQTKNCVRRRASFAPPLSFRARTVFLFADTWLSPP